MRSESKEKIVGEARSGPRLNRSQVQGSRSWRPRLPGGRERIRNSAGSGSNILLGVRGDEPCRAPGKASCRQEQEIRLGNGIGHSNVAIPGPRAAFSYLAQIVGSKARENLLLWPRLCPGALSALQAGPSRGLSPPPGVVHLWPLSLERSRMRPPPQEKASAWHSSQQIRARCAGAHLRAALSPPLETSEVIKPRGVRA